MTDGKKDLSKLKELILGISNIEDVTKSVEEALRSGIETKDIIDALNEALGEVGEKYERGEYFLSELMMAGILATEVTKTLEPHLEDGGKRVLGRVLVGTVKGDIHDIGKDIVIMMLRTAGFKVIDLGVDVPKERFVEAVKNERADVLGMSALLTSTVSEMKPVIEAIKNEGLRDRVKVMVGGRPVTKEFADEIGADGYAEDAIEAIKVVKSLMS